MLPFKFVKEEYSNNLREQIMINLNTLTLAGISGELEEKKATDQAILVQTTDWGRCMPIESQSVAN
jgi:hypothetical protein